MAPVKGRWFKTTSTTWTKRRPARIRNRMLSSRNLSVHRALRLQVALAAGFDDYAILRYGTIRADGVYLYS
jgi:hypothetical protein